MRGSVVVPCFYTAARPVWSEQTDDRFESPLAAGRRRPAWPTAPRSTAGSSSEPPSGRSCWESQTAAGQHLKKKRMRTRTEPKHGISITDQTELECVFYYINQLTFVEIWWVFDKRKYIYIYFRFSIKITLITWDFNWYALNKTKTVKTFFGMYIWQISIQ